MWSTNVPYDRLGDSFAQVRSVLEFLDLNPVREGFTFAG